MEQKLFNSMELDAIGEMMNISLGSSATAVSNLLNHRVDITTPTASVISVSEFSLGDIEPAIAVEIKYVSGIKGSNIMLLKRADVKTIVDILMGTETPDEEFKLDELTVSAVCEVMNQMMGAASTALSDFLGRPVNISTPEPFTLDDLDEFKRNHFQSDSGMLVVVRFKLGIEDVLESEFVNVMSVDLARELLAGFAIGEDSEQPKKEETPPSPVKKTDSIPIQNDQMNQAEIDKLMNVQPAGQAQPAVPVREVPAPSSETKTAHAQAPEPDVPQTQKQEPSLIRTSPVQMTSFDVGDQLGEEQAQNLELILSVPLEVSVEIGRTTRRVEEILSFSKGTLVVLDKLAGDQVDIFVNGLCVAHGDVVVIDDNFGVRITDVVHQSNLLKPQNK